MTGIVDRKKRDQMHELATNLVALYKNTEKVQQVAQYAAHLVLLSTYMSVFIMGRVLMIMYVYPRSHLELSPHTA